MVNMRTDLALESMHIHKNNEKDGIKQRQYKEENHTITHVLIESETVQNKIGKKQGEYITVEIQDINMIDINITSKIISDKIINLLKVYKLNNKDTILVAGIGNKNITPDAIGPNTAYKILATKHAIETGEKIFDNFASVAVLVPGVLGQTGFEAGDIIKSIIENNNIKALIVIDALAAASVKRLGKTIQITNTGISPGSGVQNSRKEISKNTMGIPVIAIGVPTVVDANITAYEDENAYKMFVTPRDIDEIINKNVEILSMAINTALQPNFTADEIKTMAL